MEGSGRKQSGKSRTMDISKVVIIEGEYVWKKKCCLFTH